MNGNVGDSNTKSKQKNQGFSVISVLMAIAFIGILGMIVLYISVANFQMKISDLKSKDSFYTAEKALDEIRVGLQEKVGQAMSVAYISVLEKYADREDTSLDGESLNDLRKDEFNKTFIKELFESLKDKTQGADPAKPNEAYYSLKILDAMLDSKPKEDAPDRLMLTAKSAGPIMEDYVPSATNQDSSKKAGVLLKNLKVIYEDSKGYASIIETDIHLHIPEVRFPEPSTVPDLMNMILVANQGVVCEGNNEIRGTFYAGDSKDENGNFTPSLSINGNVEVSGGDYAVCNGDIEVNTSSNFKCNAEELWVNNIEVNSADVELLGSTYVADDLTMNTLPGETTLGNARGSNVTIVGDYYGYGSQANWTKETVHKDDRYTQRSQPDSESSVIVNGKNTTLDMSGIKRLLLAGTSYISQGEVSTDTNDMNAVLMGESISVKGNQLAYLLPSEYLKSNPPGSLTNPMTAERYLLLEDDYLDYVTGAPSLGGLTLQNLIDEYGVGVTRQLRSHQDGVYAYYYLYFSDAANASAFFNRFYNDYQKENMDKYLSFYLNPEGGIQINRDVMARFITKGNVIVFEEKKGKLYLPENSNLEKVAEEQKNYANKWFALTRKMITNYDLLNNQPDSSEKPNETDPTKHVFDNLINLEKLRDYLGVGSMSKESENKSGDYYALVVDGDYTVTKDSAKKYKLIVATGNVTVKDDGDGVEFKGIIMAGGKITLGNGSTLQSDPREAAKVYQAQNDDFKKIFWEGNKYVLGNVSGESPDGDVTDDSDIYNLAQSVTYERWSKK